MFNVKRFVPAVAVAALLLSAPLFAASSQLLSLVPSDAASVGMVRVNEMRVSPLSGRLFAEADKATIDGETQRLMEETGLDPRRDVDIVVMAVAPGSSPTDKQVLVAVEGRFDAARLSTAAANKGAVRKTSPAGAYFVLPENEGEKPAVAFVDNTLVVMGTEAAVVKALAARSAGGSNFLGASPLAVEVQQINPLSTSWMVVDVPRMARLKGEHTFSGADSGSGAMIAGALKKVATVSVWATDAKTSLQFGATARSYDQETRELLEDTVRGMLAAWRMAAQEKSPELVSVIRQFEVSRKGDGVSLTGSIPADLVQKLTASRQAQK